MKVLLIKMSSLGDIIHTLPALTDAMLAIPGIEFDWVVEERFIQLPKMHKAVSAVIPIAWRRWRKNLFNKIIFNKTTASEIKNFIKLLTTKKYDLILDAQGLIKSAIVSRLAKAYTIAGFDKKSAREGIATLAYKKNYAVARNQHAVDRTRQLFAAALGYPIPTTVANYGLNKAELLQSNATPSIIFFHGTTWDTKHWPLQYWQQLAKLVGENFPNLTIKLAWGNAAEYKRAQEIQKYYPQAEILPDLNLSQLLTVLANTTAVIAVDTGLAHMAAALDVPGVGIYGPTDARLSGAKGATQIHASAKFACSPCLKRTCSYKENTEVFPACFGTVTPTIVFAELQKIL